MFWGRNRKSKETLKDRLQLVLAYDRAEIPPGKVEALRNELLEVIKRYFPPGAQVGAAGVPGLRLDVEQRGDTVVLTADIPIGSSGGRQAPAVGQWADDKDRRR